jgi:uncharacterized protein
MGKKAAFAFAAGLLFALGLVLSGMTQPAKVSGFLHLAGLAKGVSWTAAAGFWDPSLALVMGGALMVTLVAFAITPKMPKPWADTAFHLPKNNKIDFKLIAGAALFGAGWALAGYCPGPVFASLLTGGADVLIFGLAMVVGMFFAKLYLSKTP